MASAKILSVSAIIDFFEEKKTVRKAENSVTSGNVSKMVFDPETGTIRGEVHASMKNKSYQVEVVLNRGVITQCSCNCPRGLVMCHHMAALAFFAHYNLSVTDVPCKWNKKSQTDDVPLAADECFGNSKPYNPFKEPVGEAYLEKMLHGLELCAPNGLYWLTRPEPAEECINVTDIQEIIFSSDYLNASNKRHFLEERLKLSSTEIQELAQGTIGQSKNPLWLIARKHRLTASNFGRIIKADRRGKYPPSLFKTLMGSYNLDGVKQIQWGRNNEKTAMEVFQQKTGLTVEPTGVWLHQCGFLGASPDGLISSDASSLLEIKCPYKYREKSLECLCSDKSYILQYDVSTGQYVINTDHDYYHQIQGMLHILDKQLCYLVIWTPQEIAISEVWRNAEWGGNIKVLQEFYFNHYINQIIN